MCSIDQGWAREHGTLRDRVGKDRGASDPKDIESYRWELKIPWKGGVTRQNCWGSQFSSVTQSCPTLCNPMNHSMPGLPVHHQIPESTPTHAHWVSDAIQLPHPLSSPSPPALNLSQHQGLFQWVNSSHQVAKVLEFRLQHQSFQWTPRPDL